MFTPTVMASRTTAARAGLKGPRKTRLVPRRVEPTRGAGYGACGLPSAAQRRVVVGGTFEALNCSIQGMRVAGSKGISIGVKLPSFPTFVAPVRRFIL